MEFTRISTITVNVRNHIAEKSWLTVYLATLNFILVADLHRSVLFTFFMLCLIHFWIEIESDSLTGRNA